VNPWRDTSQADGRTAEEMAWAIALRNKLIELSMLFQPPCGADASLFNFRRPAMNWDSSR
jgi:hypothetical protein